MVLSWEDVCKKINGVEPDDFFFHEGQPSWLELNPIVPKVKVMPVMTVSDFVKAHDYDHFSAKGLRVRILAPKYSKRSYDGKFAGCVGTVVNGSKGVKLDGHENPRSKYGCYWFKEYELEIIEEFKEENEMVNANALKGDYKIALVDIEGSYCKGYSFALYPTEQNVVVGDYVLVDNAGGKSVGKVTNIVDKGMANAPTKEVICKLDFTNFETRKKARKERKEALAEMKKLADESQTLALYKMLAETDPRMKELLSKVEGLEDC